MLSRKNWANLSGLIFLGEITPVVFDHRLFKGFPYGEKAALAIGFATAKRWTVNSRR